MYVGTPTTATPADGNPSEPHHQNRKVLEARRTTPLFFGPARRNR